MFEEFFFYISWIMVDFNVADPDSGSGTFSAPGFGIGFFPDPGTRKPGSQNITFERLVTISWGLKSTIFLSEFFLYLLKNYMSLNFVKFEV